MAILLSGDIRKQFMAENTVIGVVVAPATQSPTGGFNTPSAAQPQLQTQADFQPLRKLRLPGVEINPIGLIFVIGPNSSGKTQFLKDIHALLTGEQRKAVVCEQIQVAKPENYESFLAGLVGRGYIKKLLDASGNELIRSTSPMLGVGPAKTPQSYSNQVANSYNNFSSGEYAQSTSQSASFFNIFGQAFTTALFLDRRLNMMNESPSFDYENTSPTNELQSLFLDKRAKAGLCDEVKQVFGKAVWIDASRANVICMRVNQGPLLPPSDDRLEPEEMKKYRTIESEGDGLRSYVGIAASLLLGVRPVSLIDEPELCLHPPQAYRMGLFIGRNGTDSKNAVFASTHSSHVLRGVLEATGNLQILRLTKFGERFKARLIGPNELKSCMSRPMIRAEAILDGVFADGVVLVEADGDRAVYQAAWESITRGRSRRDVIFIPVGGTGAFAEISAFFRRLHIPVFVIADLDLLSDSEKMRSVLESLAGTASVSAIMTNCRTVASKIKQLPPLVSVEQVRERLRDMLNCPLDWTPKADSVDDDVLLRRQLNSLARDVDRLRRLKVSAADDLIEDPGLRNAILGILNECKQVGLFLVPVGELEQWEPGELTGAPSQKRKAEWATWASANIRQDPRLWENLQQFVGEIEQAELREAARISAE